MMKTLSILFLFAIVASVSAQSSQGNWTAVRPNYAQIAVVDAYAKEGLWCPGFVSGPGPFFVQSTDGGETLEKVVDGIPIMIYADVDTLAGSNGKQAVAGGVSLLGQSIAITTSNGVDWVRSNTTVQTSAFLQVQAVSAQKYALFGTWTVRQTNGSNVEASVSGAGFAVSNNAGSTFEFVNWPYADVPPTGGQFTDGSTVYVVGSTVPAVPEQPEQQDDDFDLYVNEAKPRTIAQYERLVSIPELTAARADVPVNETFRAYLSKSTDNGATWTSQIAWQSANNLTGATLGSISFANSQVGWVAGLNRTESGVYAFLLGTTDGGANWNKLDAATVPNGIFMKVVAVSPTEVYVAGGAPGGGLFGNSIVLHSTDGGKTFSTRLIEKQALFFDLSVVDSNNLYAIGISAFQTASLYRFQ